MVDNDLDISAVQSGNEPDNDQQLFDALVKAASVGNNALNQSIVTQYMEINDDWVDVIENGIFSIENIVAHPRSFIREDYELVNVERARKVDNYAFRHLASHSEYVKSVDKNDFVTPSKVMNKHLEQDNAIYENRVVYALVLLVENFLAERYAKIKENAAVKDDIRLKVDSQFAFKSSDLSYNLDLSIKKPAPKKYAERNQNILARLDNISLRLRAIKGSAFCREMANYKRVVPPLNKTNIFAAHGDYRTCYELWLFISGYDTVGYSVDIKEKKLPPDGDYFDDLTRVIAYSFETLIKNNQAREALYKGLNFTTNKQKKFKVEKSSNVNLDRGEMFEGGDVSQFYYQKLKSLVKDVSQRSSAYDAEVEDVDASFRRFYKGLVQLNNEIVVDLLGLGTFPDREFKTESARLRSRIAAQKKDIAKYKLMCQLKRDEWVLAKRKEEREDAALKRLQKSLDRAVKKEQAELEKKRRKKAEEEAKKALIRQQELEKAEALRRKEEENQRKLAAQAKEKAKLAAQKERERAKLAEQKAKEKEKAKLAAQKERERAKLAAQKAKEKEKAKLAAQKERERAKLAAQKAKEKEKAKLAAQKEREKAKLAAQKAKEKEKENQSQTKVEPQIKVANDAEAN